MTSCCRGMLLLLLSVSTLASSPLLADAESDEGGPPANGEVQEVIEDAFEEHRPWWMPSLPRQRLNEQSFDSSFNLQVEEGRKLSLDEVVLRIRRSHDGRVVRAVETEDGFVVRLLLEGGRLRTLQVSPQGEVVHTRVED